LAADLDLFVGRCLAVWGGKIEDTYGAHDRSAFGGRVGQLGIRTDGLADPKRGQDLAARLCSGCHIVAPGSAGTANADVPTFAAIAGRADPTAERLAGRIIVPHPPMPNTQLTVAEMRDIISYILSLKPQR
jgi:mono/diheme cytochrome c family protein